MYFPPANYYPLGLKTNIDVLKSIKGPSNLTPWPQRETNSKQHSAVPISQQEVKDTGPHPCLMTREHPT